MAVTTPLSQPIVTLTRVTESFDCDVDSLSQFSQRGVNVEAYIQTDIVEAQSVGE